MVFEGILESMADGITGGKWTLREYVKIGEKRILKTATSPLIDNILNENLGNEVALSVVKTLKGNRIFAIRETNGEVTKLKGSVIGAISFLRFMATLIPLNITLYIFLAIFEDGGIGLVIGIILSLLWFILPIKARIRDKKALNALD